MPNPATKKVCKNNPKYFYTGKESSPLGLGYCALSENVGTKRIGNDDTQWIVGMKNGMRVWVRCPTELSKESPVIEKPTKIVIEDDSEEEEEAAKPPPPKKAPVKKPPPPESSSESESDEEEEKPPPPKKAPVKKSPPPPESSSESESEEEEAAPPPKKKAAAKKTPPPESSSESESEEEEKPPPKKTPAKKEAEKKAPVKRAQTDYNIYMAWKVAELGKEEPKMTHKEKFAMAAKEWKNLGDKKEEQMAKAKAFKK